jgi:MFS family permease
MGRRYHLLLGGYLVSSLGNWMYRLTIPLLVLHLTGSPLNAATVYVLEYVPFLLLSLPGGVIADRFDRRRVLIVGDLVAAGIAALIALYVTFGVDHLWVLYVATFVLGCVEPIYHPAFQSLLPGLVRDDQLEHANAWMQSGDNVISLVGPVSAGLAVATVGYEAAVYLDAATFVVSALAIALIGRVAGSAPDEQRADGRSALAELREGGRYVFRENPVLLAGALFFSGTNFAIWLVQGTFLYYLTEYRHLSPSTIGVILAAQGVGAIVGAAMSAKLIRRFAPGRVILVYTALAGAVTLLLVPLRDPVSITIIWGLLFGLSAVNIVAWFTLRQRIVPRPVFGRVVATTRMLAFASIPVAAFVGGALANAVHNVYIVFALAGVLRLAMAALGTRTPLGRRQPTSPEPEAVPAHG